MYFNKFNFQKLNGYQTRLKQTYFYFNYILIKSMRIKTMAKAEAFVMYVYAKPIVVVGSARL